MGPFSASDRHDLPGLIDEPVPGFATQRDDIVVGLEYPVGKPVIAHELPYVFDGVQLGRSWWQEHQCDVGWDLEPAGGVPSGPVDDEYSVSAWCHQGRDFIKMPLHGLSVAAGQDKARTDTARGTDGTKDIGRLRALVPGRRGSAAASRPAPGEHGFLADPGLILPPNFYRGVGREPGSDLPQPGGEVFFKSSTANSFCPLWRGRADILRNPSALNSRPTVVSSTEMRNSSNIQCARSFRRQRTTPWIAGIGPLSTSRASACRCLSLSLAGLPVALPSIRPSGPLALKRRTQSRTTWSPTVPIRAAPCDGHHRKSQPAQEAAGSVQHPSTPWLTAEAPDHQNLPVTQPLCP